MANRVNIQKDLTSTEFDVLVIGGGITGAGIALDAQLRGLNVALLEMQDFASGTSSRSTKLIHGGIRYLKQGQIGVVRKTGNERAILQYLAPHLTRPIEILIPIYNSSSLKLWQLKIGMWFFERIVSVRKRHKFKSYSDPTKVVSSVPSLNKKELKGACSYTEFLTNDARLTFSCIKTAMNMGAKVLNYSKVTEFIYDKRGKINGVEVLDTITNTRYQVKAKSIVNAGGPWVDELRDLDKKDALSELILTKGIHIVIKRIHFPIDMGVYFEADDKRMIFAVPKGDVTYIGTTDTFYTEDLANPLATGEDIQYIISSINQKFPQLALTKESVISTWAGLRPLINEGGKKPSEISRKDEVFVSDAGLISIAGGKLTGYRLMAKQVVDKITKQLVHNVPCTTDKKVLIGGDIDDLKVFTHSLCTFAVNMSCKDVEDTVSLYGSEAKVIIENVCASGQDISTEDTVLAWFDYSMEHEMVNTVDDFLVRRTELSYFNPILADKMRVQLTRKIEAIKKDIVL